MSELPERVTKVETRLDGHEDVCAERYGEIKSSFGRVHDRLDVISRYILAVLGGFAVFLLGVIGTLLYYGPPWK